MGHISGFYPIIGLHTHFSVKDAKNKKGKRERTGEIENLKLFHF